MADRIDTARAWGSPPWRNPGAQTRAEIPETPDVAIIGGGLTGLAAAYYLARKGIRAVVLEAERIGSGASGRTGGIVLEGTATGPRDGARDCVPRLQRLVSELAIPCDLHLPGCWEIDHNAGYGAAALPWIDADSPISIARTVPGGSVEPGALVGGLAEAARLAGATICEHRRVQRLTVGQSLAISTDAATIRPGHVIVAANAWTAAIVPGMPEIFSALTYACLTEPLSDRVLEEIGLRDHMPFYTADTPYLWGRVTAEGGVVFGAGLTRGEPAKLERLAFTDHEPHAIMARLEDRVHGLNPALKDVRIVARWAGPVAFREGMLPLLTRHPDATNLLVAGAYAGHGVAFSVQAGALMAAAISDGAALPPWGGF